MRVSLERAMVHGDAFNAKELRDLTKHPLLRLILEQSFLPTTRFLVFFHTTAKISVNARRITRDAK
jgi:hypothetical protein